jgi:putative ABC transport system permease protein
VGWGYVALTPGADPEAVVAKLKTIIDQSIDLKKIAKLDMRGSALVAPRLTLFRDDHLSTDKYGSMTAAGSWTTIYGFAVIGVLILLIDCFNFTNLATARATLRAREISLRKIVGATRGQLVVQFLTEAILVALISLVLAFALVETLLPMFNSFLGKAIALHYLADWKWLLAATGIAIFAGFLSGIYPALILSGFRPAATLRSGATTLSGSALLRTSLVVLQFAVSIGLGTAVLVVFAQISFARDVGLGFRQEGVVIVDAQNLSASARKGFADTLRANPKITDVALSDSVPFDDNTMDFDIHAPGSPSTEAFRVVSASPGYMRLYGVRTLAGRVLSETRQQDALQATKPYNILINASGARRLGYSVAEAIGKTVTLHTTPVTIVGVVEDMKMAGPKQQVDDTIYRYQPGLLPIVSIRIGASHLPGTLAFIDRTWRQFAPTSAISRRFLNDDFQRQFQSDEKQGRIFGIFVGIAIFIACLGLFGLSAFAATRRTREIGIRKVFGARTQDVVLLLLLQFSLPVLVANLIAWPFAWYYLHDWLEGYAYRISLSPSYFLEAGAAALVIAWATVFVHARRVANANPIHALRTE